MVEAARESKKVKIPLVAAELRRLVHSSYCQSIQHRSRGACGSSQREALRYMKPQ